MSEYIHDRQLIGLLIGYLDKCVCLVPEQIQYNRNMCRSLERQCTHQSSASHSDTG